MCLFIGCWAKRPPRYSHLEISLAVPTVADRKRHSATIGLWILGVVATAFTISGNRIWRPLHFSLLRLIKWVIMHGRIQ